MRLPGNLPLKIAAALCLTCVGVMVFLICRGGKDAFAALWRSGTHSPGLRVPLATIALGAAMALWILVGKRWRGGDSGTTEDQTQEWRSLILAIAMGILFFAGAIGMVIYIRHVMTS